MTYWDDRYRRRLGSGPGSVGKAAEWKASIINPRLVGSVLDVGCGDGTQAALYDTGEYLGVDASPEALRLAAERCPDKRFAPLEQARPADTHLSIEVIFHLLTDWAYREHMDILFSARRRVIVFSSDHDGAGAPHVRHHNFTADVPPGWVLSERIGGGLQFHSDFYVWDRE